MKYEELFSPPTTSFLERYPFLVVLFVIFVLHLFAKWITPK